MLGGKEGVAHIALACLEPGDVCLSPEPGYPPYTSGPLFAGADIHYLPLREENEFLPISTRSRPRSCEEPTCSS